MKLPTIILSSALAICLATALFIGWHTHIEGYHWSARVDFGSTPEDQLKKDGSVNKSALKETKQVVAKDKGLSTRNTMPGEFGIKLPTEGQ